MGFTLVSHHRSPTPAVVRRRIWLLQQRTNVRHTVRWQRFQGWMAPWISNNILEHHEPWVYASGGWGLWVISIPHKTKRTLEVFPFIISSPFSTPHWEVFRYMGHCKWTEVVAYLFLSKLFPGLPLLLCDMPLKRDSEVHAGPTTQKHYYDYPAMMRFLT